MKIWVEVVYALADSQTMVEVKLEEGATVGEAIVASGILQRHPEIRPDSRIGIWGRVVTPDTKLRDRDRVELYRPLTADPKQSRRKRAEEQRGRGR